MQAWEAKKRQLVNSLPADQKWRTPLILGVPYNSAIPRDVLLNTALYGDDTTILKKTFGSIGKAFKTLVDIAPAAISLAEGNPEGAIKVGEKVYGTTKNGLGVKRYTNREYKRSIGGRRMKTAKVPLKKYGGTGINFKTVKYRTKAGVKVSTPPIRPEDYNAAKAYQEYYAKNPGYHETPGRIENFPFGKGVTKFNTKYVPLY